MWKYILERFAYDAGRAVVRETVKAHRATPTVSNTVAAATLEARTVMAENLRPLAHKKYELLSVDQYGLLNDDAWIEHWTLFTRHTLIPSLSSFTQDVAMAALGATQADFIAELNATVLQISKNVIAASGIDASPKDKFILENF